MRVQLHRRARIFDDYAGLLQPDKRNEKPDTCCDTVLQARADCVENQLAQSNQRQNQKQHTRNEHHTERDLPSVCKAGCRRGRNRRENEKEIFAHARSLGDGITCIECHDRRCQRG